MADKTMTLMQLREIVDNFVKEREWTQYHSPKNLSMNISIEANELMEKFLWLTTQESVEEIAKNKQEISDELADVLFGILCFANVSDIDISDAFQTKIGQIAKKYPVDKSKGKREKYTQL